MPLAATLPKTSYFSGGLFTHLFLTINMFFIVLWPLYALGLSIYFLFVKNTTAKAVMGILINLLWLSLLSFLYIFGLSV